MIWQPLNLSEACPPHSPVKACSSFGFVYLSLLVQLYGGSKYEKVKKKCTERGERTNNYDFIVVGAGSAGCVVANRLSENSKSKILLLEAGPEQPKVTISPALYRAMLGSNVDWGYKTQSNGKSCLARPGGSCSWPRVHCKTMLKEFTHLFTRHTLPSRRHLTPEIVLRLITPLCTLWSSPVEKSPFIDPFWGFYWPGGQATARYILDNPELVKGRKVLDVGCGCGAGSIAAAIAKAKKIIANDIDPYALIATRINASLNDVHIDTDENDFIGSSCDDLDAILIGDMFYDEEFAKMLFDWLNKLTMNDKLVIIGDPGRHGLTASRRSRMTQLAKYNLSKETCEENNGFTETSVWMLNKP